MRTGQCDRTELATQSSLIGKLLSYLRRKEHIGSRNELRMKKIVAESIRILPSFVELMIDIIAAIGQFGSGSQHSRLELLLEICLHRSNERASARLRICSLHTLKVII